MTRWILVIGPAVAAVAGPRRTGHDRPVLTRLGIAAGRVALAAARFALRAVAYARLQRRAPDRRSE
jgi:hypothetical protein